MRLSVVREFIIIHLISLFCKFKYLKHDICVVFLRECLCLGWNARKKRLTTVYYSRLLCVRRKNKSFRPRERPKKGLKNLQTVKTLTAGQNLSNQSTVKTRKQPLTVTAQFQNSLSALMDTLNQV